MSAVIIQLANAVVSDLNAHAFSQNFTATRAYLPRFDLEGGTGLQVSVVPKTDVRQPATRAEDECTETIDIGVMQRLAKTGAEEIAEVDGLMGLCEEVKTFLSRRRPAAMPEAVCVEVKHEPIYSVEDLNENRLFLSVISAVFHTNREV